MKKILLFSSFFLFFGCANAISEEDLEHLNGYWEIEKVIFPDGSSKEYSVNTSIDYISVESKKGYRKKVHPKLNGTYFTSDDADLFVVLPHENRFTIHYGSKENCTPMAQRSEELISLSENRFSVRNEEGITYQYKRFEPIDIKE
ncbi:MAG: hypothetical protein ACR2MT_04305 [Aurantibacter sp.]